MNLKNILVLPIKSIQVSILDSKRRQAAYDLEMAKNKSSTKDISSAQHEYDLVNEKYQFASGEKITIRQDLN